MILKLFTNTTCNHNSAKVEDKAPFTHQYKNLWLNVPKQEMGTEAYCNGWLQINFGHLGF